MFRRRRIEDNLEEKRAELQEELDRLIRARTELMDLRIRAEAGLVTGASTDELVRQLHLLTLRKGNLELAKKIRQQRQEAAEEAARLQKEIEALEQELQQPPPPLQGQP